MCYNSSTDERQSINIYVSSPVYYSHLIFLEAPVLHDISHEHFC
jgi:hypothetical protein